MVCPAQSRVRLTCGKVSRTQPFPTLVVADAGAIPSFLTNRGTSTRINICSEKLQKLTDLQPADWSSIPFHMHQFPNCGPGLLNE